jgi:predicted MFS family arabinose efflux permease
MNKANKIFYGWWIVIALAIMGCTACWTVLSVVLKQLMVQFGTGRGEVSLAQSISILTGSVAGMITGRLLLNRSPRKFILLGSTVNGLCLLLLGLSNWLWYFYIVSFISGATMGFYGVIVTFTLLSKWFTRRWGMAIGFVQGGSFLGLMAMTPLVALIADSLGWRASYFFLGFLVLAINTPLILFVLKDTPRSVNLLPDGDKPDDPIDHTKAIPHRQTPAKSTGSAKISGFSAAFKHPALWLVCVCFGFLGIGYSVVTTHEVAFITDMNVSITDAASALGFTIGLTAVANLVSGWMANRVSSRYITVLFNILAIAGMLVLLRADTMPKVWLFVVLFGLGIGASGTLLPIITRDIFGSANFSALFGITNVSYSIGFAIGAPLAGFLFDATGSYQAIFIVVASIFMAATLAVYLAFGVRPKPLMRSPGRLDSLSG